MSNFELVESVDAENPVEGDLKLTDSQLTLTSGSTSIAQHLRNRLRFFKGEWFLDLRLGFPFFQDVLVKNPRLRRVRSLIRQTIRQTPGVNSVSKLKITVGSDRVAVVDFEAGIDGSDQPLVFENFILGEL